MASPSSSQTDASNARLNRWAMDSKDARFAAPRQAPPVPARAGVDEKHDRRGCRPRTIALIAAAALLVVLVAVLVPVGVLVIGRHGGHSKAGTGTGAPASASTTASAPAATSTSGTPAYAVGTVLDTSTWLDTTDFNTTFTNATVGGLPVMGLNSSYDNSGRASARVPPLSDTWNYTQAPMRGVNLGGWLILEPFITPSLFDYDASLGVVDEYTLSKHLGADLQAVVEKHYATFVTEADFAEIAELGLDHVRIPYPYWAVGNLAGDPYLEKVSWRYLLRAIEWARKHGLRVNVDLHSVPGNANGWNHSGREGTVGWLNGTDGDYYGNLTIRLHEQLAEFFAQDRYAGVVTLYGLVNEPNLIVLDGDRVIDWTKRAYAAVRAKGLAAYVVFGDGFRGAASWYNVFPPADYPGMVLDLHQYMIFDAALIAQSHTSKIGTVCAGWSDIMEVSTNPLTGHGPTMVGEWSQADTDCLRYLNNVGVGSRWEGTLNVTNTTNQILTPSCPGGVNCTCAPTNVDPALYEPAYSQFLKTFAEAQMTAFESNGGWGSMYWAWKTETADATQWSYQRGVKANILPSLSYDRTFNCSAVPDFTVLGLAENY